MLVGLLRLRTMDPTTSRGPWKSIAHSLGKELVVFAGSVSQDELLDVTWGRWTQKE